MMLYDFVLVGKPFEVLASWFWAPPAGLLSEAAVVGFRCDGRLEHSTTRKREDAVVLAVYWTGAGGPGLFNHLEGDLELAPLREGRSHLSLSASCDPPGEDWAMRRDRLRVKRETEARVRAFLDLVAQSLAHHEPAP